MTETIAHVLLLLAMTPLAGPGTTQQPRTQPPEPTPAEWREDLAVLRARLPAGHINLFHLLPEAEFHQAIDELSAATDTAQSAAIRVGLARLVAAVGEGHTSARILTDDMTAFPILTQVEDSGVYIRRVDHSHGELLGGRILRVDGRPIGDVLTRLGTVISADNARGEWAWIPFYLVTQEVLLGLGLLDAQPGLTLMVERLDGIAQEIVLEARPLPEAQRLMLGDAPAMISAGDGAPPLIRDRRSGSYWFEWLPEERAMFVRIDRLVSQTQWPFTAFVDSLFAELGRRPAERLVLDIRSLSGGNHISLPLVHALIRSDRLAERGRLFVLIGRGTFSAGQNLVTLLDQHVAPIFVGEPTGGRPNGYGVLGRFTLPNSGLEIRYSRYFNQDADPADYRHWQEPHIAAGPSTYDELRGRDAALEVALTFEGRFSWSVALADVERAWDGGAVDGALATARARAEELRDGGWLVEREVNGLGYRLLRAGDVASALAVFRFNVDLFPDAWNAFDSLGEGLIQAGLTDEAVAAYRRSLALNGYNENAERQLRLLALRLPPRADVP